MLEEHHAFPANAGLAVPLSIRACQAAFLQAGSGVRASTQPVPSAGPAGSLSPIQAPVAAVRIPRWLPGLPKTEGWREKALVLLQTTAFLEQLCKECRESSIPQLQAAQPLQPRRSSGEQQPASPAPASAAKSECQLSVIACEQGHNGVVTKAQPPLHPEVPLISFWHIPRGHFFQGANKNVKRLHKLPSS